jgi:pimeloyl-ACP methyl ester carboxylesterase
MTAGDRLVTLPDGRRLAYGEYGDPSGTAVLYFHGGLSSHLDVAFASPLCLELGIRLLALDRPGIGLSDPKPGRPVAAWADDVAGFAGALGLDRFAVLGWSAGGPYALACAHALGAVVSKVATVGGMAPVDDPRALRELAIGADRLLFPLSRRAPRSARAVLRLAKFSPPTVAKWSALRELRSPADRAALAAISAEEIAGWFSAAVRRNAGGIVDDYRALADDWGFRLEQVAADVIVFQGEEDEVVSMRDARLLVDGLPRGELRVVRAAGHFLLRRHAEVVFAALV